MEGKTLSLEIIFCIDLEDIRRMMMDNVKTFIDFKHDFV